MISHGLHRKNSARVDRYQWSNIAPQGQIGRASSESDEAYLKRIFDLAPDEAASLEGHMPIAAAVTDEAIRLIERTPHRGEVDSTTMRRWLVEGRIRLAGGVHAPLDAMLNPLLAELLLEGLRNANRIPRQI